MTAINITEMGIVPMLSAVLGGRLPEIIGSTVKKKDGEKERGVITSVPARRLLTANLVMAEHIAGLVKEHSSLHEDEESVVDHDCEMFAAKIQRLRTRKNVLHSLLWQAVTEEHPLVAANNAGIREGWLLVDQDGEWDDIVPTYDRLNIINRIINHHITAIVCGGQIPVREEILDPVASDEEIIGSIEDECVKMFRYLMMEIRDEVSKQLPSGIMEGDSKFIGNMTINEVTRLQVLAMHFKKLLELTSSLFWCSVRDTIPAAADIPSIGIRRDWKVVKCVPDEDEGIKMIMTPMGPAIMMKIPIPAN